MVSFQCDGCTDVVKKPKLDNHYGQCRSSFTCIDCSSTFAGPVEWKGHTSCITEAEKYQKSLYKGPKRGQGSRPVNGRQSYTQLKTTNATGKYHQSNGSQSSWSRPQYIRNCASGANSTPLGSPRRMSPVDNSEVKPSPLDANDATKPERGDVKKRDAEKHTPNGTEPKEKKRKKKHDAPRERDGKDAPPPRDHDETSHEASKVKGSSEGHKRSETSGNDTQSKTQFATEGIPGTSGDKKIKKRKKEEKGEKARLKQGDVSKETNTPPEPVAPSVDDGTKGEKKVKKRKHKREEETETNHGSLAATGLEPLASQTDDAKGEKKKKKRGKEEKAAGKKRKHEDSVANEVEKTRKQERETSGSMNR